MAHNDQCNLCGAFDDSTTRAVNPCEYCSTPVCSLCFGKHNTFCKDLTASKRRGLGPTVANTQVPDHRRGHEAPPTTGPDRPVRGYSKPAVLAAPYNLSPSSAIPVAPEPADYEALAVKMFPGLILKPLTEGVAPAPIDQQIDAVKDLQKES